MISVPTLNQTHCVSKPNALKKTWTRPKLSNRSIAAASRSFKSCIAMNSDSSISCSSMWMDVVSMGKLMYLLGQVRAQIFTLSKAPNLICWCCNRTLCFRRLYLSRTLLTPIATSTPLRPILKHNKAQGDNQTQVLQLVPKWAAQIKCWTNDAQIISLPGRSWNIAMRPITH